MDRGARSRRRHPAAPRGEDGGKTHRGGLTRARSQGGCRQQARAHAPVRGGGRARALRRRGRAGPRRSLALLGESERVRPGPRRRGDEQDQGARVASNA